MRGRPALLSLYQKSIDVLFDAIVTLVVALLQELLEKNVPPPEVLLRETVRALNGFLAAPMTSLLSTVILPEHVLTEMVNAEVVKASWVMGTSTCTPLFALSDLLLAPVPEVLVTVTLALYDPLSVPAGSVMGMVALWFNPLVSGVLGEEVTGEVATLATPVVVPAALVE